MYRFHKQSGAVSLFVVIFAALLMTVVTVSFIRIMVQSQQQASATDLSQSAFDSAQAGVEDAKRALLRYQSVCSGADADACAAALSKINSTTCNDAVNTLSDVSPETNGEIKIQVGGTNTLDQFYTCIKIKTQTDDYVGELGQDGSKFIPLIGTSEFNRIKIEWFSSKDLRDSTTAYVPAFISGTPPLLNDWNTTEQNRPSILRSQLIQFNNTSFSLDEFDNNTNNASNNTLFLYPSNIVDAVKSFASNARRIASGGPVQVHCTNLSSSEPYACSSIISIPQSVSSNNYTQFLNLTSLYKGAHYKVTLWNNDEPVKFDNVQPSIDSTGRANDLFRRVQARVEMTNVNFPYPQAEIYTAGNLCKNFMVTDDPADYASLNENNNCTP